MGRKKFAIDEPCSLPFARLGALAKALLVKKIFPGAIMSDLHRAAFAVGEFDSVSTAEMQVEREHYQCSVPSVNFI